MPIVKVNDPSRVGSWNNKIPFPKNRYTIRCVEEDLTESSAGNPMVVRTWELFQQSPVQIGDKSIDVDGLKITQYRVLSTKNDDGSINEEKTGKNISSFIDELKILGYDGEEVDTENPPLICKNKVVADAIVYGKKNPSFGEPTAEDRAKGKKVGSPIKDANGKEVIIYQLQIESILGLSTVETNRPY